MRCRIVRSFQQFKFKFINCKYIYIHVYLMTQGHCNKYKLKINDTGLNKNTAPSGGEQFRNAKVLFLLLISP